MRATSFQVKNVLGLQEMSVELGKVTTASGANATGKSSWLEALKATLGRGALGRLARIGTDEEPETVLVLDDGAYRIERSAKKTRVKKRVGDSAAYEDVPRAQGFLDSLFDAQLSNPVAFLTAKPGDRVDLLLEALPLEVDWPALREKLGAWPEGMQLDAVSGLHPLVGLALVREALYDERTGVSRSQRDKASSAYELKKTLPASTPEDTAEEIAAAEKRLRDLRDVEAKAQSAQEAAEATLRGDFKAAVAKLRAASEEEQAALRAACERECLARAQVCHARVESLRLETDTAIDESETSTDERLEGTRADIEAQAAGLATLRERETRATKDAEGRRLADKFEAESEELALAADLLTNGIDNLDKARRALAKDLPIEGLEVRDREIYLEDIPFTTLNTAKRIKLAVQIATLRAKDAKLPIVFLDGVEALDADHFEILKKELEASNVQAFLAKVDEGPLSVEAS